MSEKGKIITDGAATAAPVVADTAEDGSVRRRRRIYVLSVGFDPLSPEEAAESLFLAASRKKEGNGGERLPFTVVTPNPISVMKARNDPELAAALSDADLSIPDGTGIVGAAKRAGTPLPARVTGIDTAEEVISRLAVTGGSLYIYGGKPGRAAEASAALAEKYRGLKIAGYADGYSEDMDAAAGKIAEAAPDLLAVCLGVPEQEIWLARHRKELAGTGAAIAAGGAVDVWSGHLGRAPELFRRLRIEWLWRMLRQPSRLRGLPAMAEFRLLTRRVRPRRKGE